MRVLALAGSPRKGGNTDVLADECLRGGQQAGADVEKVYLDDLNIGPIGDVGEVRTYERVDVRSDDDFPKLLERFLDADIVVIASPVYWFGVSAQTKCFIDRLSCYFRVPPYANRFDGKGYVILCSWGADRPNHGKSITEPLKGCVEVLRGEYLGDFGVREPSPKKGMTRQNAAAMQSAFELGQNAVRKMQENQSS